MIARLRLFPLSRLRERVGVRGVRRAGLTLGTIAGAFVALELIGFVATVYFHKELLAQAEAAGLADLMPR